MDLSLSEQYRRFLSWQCRLRKKSVRELGGMPTTGMSAGVFSVSGGEEQCRLNFLILRRETEELNSEFRHIIRKTPDPAEWQKNGLRILSERHYQDDTGFSNQLTALFNLDSPVVAALIAAGSCRLKFNQDSIDYAFDFEVSKLEQDHTMFQATYWHNHLFNPAMPGKVIVLGFVPVLGIN